MKNIELTWYDNPSTKYSYRGLRFKYDYVDNILQVAINFSASTNVPGDEIPLTYFDIPASMWENERKRGLLMRMILERINERLSEKPEQKPEPAAADHPIETLDTSSIDSEEG